MPTPALEEQRRIADILDHVEHVRAMRHKGIGLLGELKDSVFHRMFADPGHVTRFGRGHLGDAAGIQGGLQVTKTRDTLPLRAPYLRVANVHRGRLDLSEVKDIGVTEGELARVLLQAGDLLLVEGHGNSGEIGRAAMWDGSVQGCVHQNHLIRVRPDRTRLLPSFVEAYLNSRAGRRHLLRSANTTSGLNTISTSVVKQTPVMFPPIGLQREFEVRLEAISRQLRLSRAHVHEVDALASALNHRAFRGKL
ncbi:hypothetical protein [Blastococcus sp. CCUG 61487]|uniref:restriction endonuclease subunit S n=1 Tax=Blastococcus sp. CCUG 61487 TaxID=1840703 RepID=UPI0010BFBD62|nr:hypothetical protein [Blastococcus sp. CCUG 61487]